VFPLRRFGVIAIQASCLAALVLGIAWNLRFAVADLLARRNQANSTRLAMRWMPGNGGYPAQLADEVYALDPVSAKSLLQRAVQLNRYDAASWIQLGLLSEAGEDLPGAEKALLQAASVDATFLPSWSLANYYFRRENTPRFWYWAQKAAQMDPDDAAPLFRLAWYVSPNAAEIDSRLQIKRPQVAVQFVNFLMAQGDPTAATEAASRLLAANTEGNTQTLLEVCDWLIANNHPDLALPLWNGLASRGQIAYAPVGVNSTEAVTNGGFAKSPISRGFDWHLRTVEGVSSFLNVSPNALGFEFSGDEPDSFLIMDQTAPVEKKICPGRKLRDKRHCSGQRAGMVGDGRSIGRRAGQDGESFVRARKRSVHLLCRPGWSRIRASIASLPAAAGHGADRGKACA